MVRAIWKGPVIQDFILKQVILLSLNLKSYKIFKIFSRNVTIFPSFVGLNFDVYNGKKFISIYIKTKMIGSKLGSFISTRKPIKHK